MTAGSRIGGAMGAFRVKVAPVLSALAMSAAVLLTITSCGSATSAKSGASASGPHGETPQLPVTVESADGEQVTVTDVSRIVSLRGPISEVLYGLGLGGNVVGRDVSTTIDEAKNVKLVTNGHDTSAESVLSLEPTLVLADADAGPSEALRQIRAVGVPVVIFEPSVRVEDIGSQTIAVAKAVGLESAGRKLAERVMSQVHSVESEFAHQDNGTGGKRAPRVAFLYLRGSAGVYLLGGPGSGADSMIRSAGGVDVGTELGLTKAFTPLTSEALVKAAPDVLLLTTSGLESVGGIEGLLSTPGISQTPAAQHKRVVTIEDGFLYSFGTRTPDALRKLANEFAAGELASK